MLSELLLLGGFGDEGTERADGSSLEVCMQRAELDNGIGVQSLNLVRNESRSAMNATDENVKCNCFACFAVGAQPGREGKPWLVCRSEQWQKLNQENVCLIPFIFSSGGIQSVTTNHFHGTQKNPDWQRYRMASRDRFLSLTPAASADRIVAAAVDVVVVLAPSVAPLGVPTNAPHSGAEHWLSACWPTSRRDSRASA